MSLDLQVFAKQLSDDLIPKLKERLNQLDMTVEIYPDFSFKNQSGFLPFKFLLKSPPVDIVNDKELISGFELYVQDFDLLTYKESLKPKPGFLDKLFGKKSPEVTLGTPEIENRLGDCRKQVIFVWHAGDSFEVRFAVLTSAILTELTGGVCWYPADDIWYDNNNLVKNSLEEIRQFEQSLTDKTLTFHEFEGWK